MPSVDMEMVHHCSLSLYFHCPRWLVRVRNKFGFTTKKKKPSSRIPLHTYTLIYFRLLFSPSSSLITRFRKRERFANQIPSILSPINRHLLESKIGQGVMRVAKGRKFMAATTGYLHNISQSILFSIISVLIMKENSIIL